MAKIKRNTLNHKDLVALFFALQQIANGFVFALREYVRWVRFVSGGFVYVMRACIMRP